MPGYFDPLAHTSFNMADIATPSAATMSTIDAGAEPPAKATKAKPEKPNETTYKEALKVAEQAHTKAQEKLVRVSWSCAGKCI